MEYAKACFNLGLAYDVHTSEKADTCYLDSLKVFCHIKNNHVDPDMIYYQFMPINGKTLQSLLLKQFFIANPQDFNDPYDCPILEEIKDDPNNDIPILQAFAKKFRVRSMSTMARAYMPPHHPTNDSPANEAWNNILMWGHYADSHKGICIGYQFRKEFFTHHPTAFIQAVQYKEDFTYNKQNFIWEDGLLIKYKPWAYEQEHRLIYFDEKEQTPLLLDREKNGQAYIDIKEVIFGCKCPTPQQKMI